MRHLMEALLDAHFLGYTDFYPLDPAADYDVGSCIGMCMDSEVEVERGGGGQGDGYGIGPGEQTARDTDGDRM